jgi:hypothetical protein
MLSPFATHGTVLNFYFFGYRAILPLFFPDLHLFSSFSSNFIFILYNFLYISPFFLSPYCFSFQRTYADFFFGGGGTCTGTVLVFPGFITSVNFAAHVLLLLFVGYVLLFCFCIGSVHLGLQHYQYYRYSTVSVFSYPATILSGTLSYSFLLCFLVLLLPYRTQGMSFLSLCVYFGALLVFGEVCLCHVTFACFVRACVLILTPCCVMTLVCVR